MRKLVFGTFGHAFFIFTEGFVLGSPLTSKLEEGTQLANRVGNTVKGAFLSNKDDSAEAEHQNAGSEEGIRHDPKACKGKDRILLNGRQDSIP